MTYLVDTDWVADHLKGREPVVSTLLGLADEGLAISTITYGEIYDGIYAGRDPTGHERGFRSFLRAVRVLPLSRATMRWFASVRGDLRRRGQPFGDMDLLIAATALGRDLTLLTRNRREFGRISGLRLYEA